MTPEGQDHPAMTPEGQGRPSGLRNPAGAVRALGTATLVMEMIVLLLAIVPIRVLGGELSGAAVGVVVGLAVVVLVLAGLLGRRWAWPVAGLLQLCLLAAGFLHWSLGVLGVIFGLAWLYVLHVRRVILG